MSFMSVFTMDSTQKREKKLSQVVKYFLQSDDYSFTDGIMYMDEIGGGYFIQLTSLGLDYQTHLSNEYIDSHKIDEILANIRLSITRLNTYGDD